MRRSSGRPPLKVRTYLVIFSLAVVAPMIAFATMAVLALDRQQRAAVERGAVETARALSHAVDRELGGMATTLETLGASRSLERDDLAAFYEDARRVLARRPEWNTIILISPAGQLVMDTHFPFGTPLPSIVERESFETVMRTGKPIVGPIRFGPVSRRFANAIRVPIFRSGRIVYVLTGVLEIAGVQRILSAQQLPVEWVGTIFDSSRTVVARTRGPERFVGQTVSPEFAKVLGTEHEGWTVTHTLEGAAVYTAFSRSPTTGWGVGLGIPRSAVDGPLRRSLWTIAAAGLALLLLGTGLALLVGRRLARGLEAVAGAVGAIGRREPVRVRATGLVEIDQVATGLATAAAMRDQAEHALRENEARLGTTLASIGDGVIATDVQGRITLLNPAAAALTGWSQADATGQDVAAVFRIVNEQSGQPAADPVRRVLTEGTVVGLANDTVLLSQDGRQIPIEDSAAPIVVPGGATAGVVLVFHDASARRQAMAEFRLVANAAPVLMWMAGPDAGYTFVNRPWLDFTGRPLATQLGDGWTAGVHPEDLARCRETARTAFDRRLAYEVEYRLRRHDGEYRWMLHRGVPRYQPDGRFAGYIGSCLDITERRQGEEVRRYLAAIVDGSDDAIVSKTLDGIITSWNAGAARMFGYTAEEAVGQPITLIIPADRVDEEAAVLARIRRGQGIDHIETVRIRKDGTRLEIALTVSPIRDPEGRIVGASKIGRDITQAKRLERERAELLRREQSGRLEAEALARISRDLALSLDPQTVGQRIVESMCRVLGGSVAVLYSVDPQSGDLVALARAGPIAGRLGDDYRLRQGAGLVGLAVRERRPVVTPDLLADARIWYPAEERERIDRTGHRAACAAPLVVGDDVIGALGIGYEPGQSLNADVITLAERFGDLAAITLSNARSFAREQRLRTEAEAANRAKDDFLATLSHELRTPLSAILGWAQVLRTRGDAATQPHAIASIERNARLQVQLIEDLLDLSRIVAGKVRLETRPVELGPVLLAAIETIRPAAEAKSLELVVQIDAAPAVVRGDPDRLQQIFSNLLSNAMKFTPSHGRVTAELERTDSRAIVRVSDSGQGIRAEALPYIFERFRQADSSLTRAHGGLGLGLAIVRHLVELQDGTVGADSPGEGQGATFTVMFPLVLVRLEDHRSSSLPSYAVHEGPRCDGLRVLIVDDEADARMLLSSFLENVGAEVTVARTVQEALELLDHRAFDVVVSDLAMPEEDGFALARRVRARPASAGGRIPLVALTAHAGTHMRVQALTSGFDTYLAKPVEPVELAAVVQQLGTRARAEGA
jgi:PAS domain S-box-containing protein